MIDPHLSASLGRPERSEGHPKSLLHLRAEGHRWPWGQREYKWSNHNRRQHRRARMEVVEDAESFGGREIDTHFFVGFANSGGEEIGVAGFSAPAGECDLARPDVAGAHRAMDKQYLEAFITIVQYYGDGRRDHSRFERNFDGSKP